jgi:ribosome biogenesis protein SSF1/2
MPKRGSKRIKTKTQQGEIPDGARTAEDSNQDVPRSIVVKGGSITSNIQDLIHDLRKLMSPNTASNLREKRFALVFIVHLTESIP